MDNSFDIIIIHVDKTTGNLYRNLKNTVNCCLVKWNINMQFSSRGILEEIRKKWINRYFGQMMINIGYGYAEFLKIIRKEYINWIIHLCG